MRLIGFDLQDMIGSGYLWPIVDLHVKYVRAARFGDRLARAAPRWWNGSSASAINYLVTDLADGARGGACGQTVQVAVRPPENELLFVMPECLTGRVANYLRWHAEAPDGGTGVSGTCAGAPVRAAASAARSRCAWRATGSTSSCTTTRGTRRPRKSAGEVQKLGRATPAAAVRRRAARRRRECPGRRHRGARRVLRRGVQCRHRARRRFPRHDRRRLGRRRASPTSTPSITCCSRWSCPWCAGVRRAA
jgi:acyl-CoA thioester hydrolase